MDFGGDGGVCFVSVIRVEFCKCFVCFCCRFEFVFWCLDCWECSGRVGVYVGVVVVMEYVYGMFVIFCLFFVVCGCDCECFMFGLCVGGLLLLLIVVFVDCVL